MNQKVNDLAEAIQIISERITSTGQKWIRFQGEKAVINLELLSRLKGIMGDRFDDLSWMQGEIEATCCLTSDDQLEFYTQNKLGLDVLVVEFSRDDLQKTSSSVNSSAAKSVFISYAQDGKTEERVREVVDQLRNDGISVLVDYDDHESLGGELLEWMKTSIVGSKYTILLCSKAYKLRAEWKRGGVGRESVIIDKQLYDNHTTNKYIPIAIEGGWNDCVPEYIETRRGLELFDKSDLLDVESYHLLLKKLMGTSDLIGQAVRQVPEPLQKGTYGKGDIVALINRCNPDEWEYVDRSSSIHFLGLPLSVWVI